MDVDCVKVDPLAMANGTSSNKHEVVGARTRPVDPDTSAPASGKDEARPKLARADEGIVETNGNGRALLRVSGAPDIASALRPFEPLYHHRFFILRRWCAVLLLMLCFGRARGELHAGA